MILRSAAAWRLAAPFFFSLAATLPAQQPAAVTAADYAHAEKFLPFNLTPLVTGTVQPNWIADREEFWFRKTSSGAAEFVLVDAATGAEQPAFDHQKLAAALGTLTGRTLDPKHLPFPAIDFSPDMRSVTIALGPKRYLCDRAGAACAPLNPAQPDITPTQSLSPDGKRAVFIRDWNLWLRDVATGHETQLTHDGVKDFGYATDNAGWVSSDRPIVLWSPDSKKIATFQQDQRNVGDMYLVETKVGHPVLHQWKYPLPGDDTVTMIQRVIIDADSGAIVRLKMPPDQHRSTLCDNITCGVGLNHAPRWEDVEWAPDAKTLAFVSTSRDHKDEKLRLADSTTGEVRDIYEEQSPTQFESGQGRVNWHYLPESGEFLWYSERDNWGHLYLYDLRTGKLRNQITTGDGSVSQVLRVDAASRRIWFTAIGREPGDDPYFTHLYRVDFDGHNLTPLTPEPGNHAISASASGRYFVDSKSTPQTPPITVLRDENGKVVASLGQADISQLLSAGWQPPISIRLKARDGKTDLYGLLFQPTHLDKSRKYPIVDSIYPGPQRGSVGSRSFSPARGDTQALAELGFIVVQIDGMGTTDRSRSFRDLSYGNMGDNTLPDQIAAIRQLAQQDPWIDLDRVGIYGHSGGGFAAADAMLRYPDFFKVGIAESGNHDNREYEDDWGERYQGLLTKNSDGATNYDDQANQNLAKNLKGHLLLAHGTMDNNVPPYNTVLLVDALIKANKDFDLLLLPNQHHGYGSMTNYMTRRRWDYFVRWLLNTEPPKEFEIKSPPPQPGMPAGPGEP
ncbi:MAG: DPP IV N-terminal domain-containing protein [Acidobacteriaceae bacterium]